MKHLKEHPLSEQSLIPGENTPPSTLSNDIPDTLPDDMGDKGMVDVTITFTDGTIKKLQCTTRTDVSLQDMYRFFLDQDFDEI